MCTRLRKYLLCRPRGFAVVAVSPLLITLLFGSGCSKGADDSAGESAPKPRASIPEPGQTKSIGLTPLRFAVDESAAVERTVTFGEGGTVTATDSDGTVFELAVPNAALERVAADSAAASQLAARDAELLDMLAHSGLEPRLQAAVPTLAFLAAARPNRHDVGG